MNQSTTPSVAVIGLGYVGLPLAVALAHRCPTIGFDIDSRRVAELNGGFDRTREIDSAALAASSLKITDEPDACRDSEIFIVTVPTPIDADNVPDLTAVRAATRTVGRLLSPNKRAIVVYESTVYPGVTEEICGPLLEEVSGLKCGEHFFLGYSPERINPGDREHTVDRIVKVVAGQDKQTLDRLADLYSLVTEAGVFRAASIRAAEAAKVIENAQRDINIAFMNEVAQIFHKMDIGVWDVLAAAGTKWNFLPFQPGLVGGHCIGVDPYYLSYRAQQIGYSPDVILAGRAINDGMGDWVADRLHARRDGVPGSVAVLGLTFKEDVPDLRNSRVVDVVRRLEALGHVVTVHDPLADADEAAHEFGISLKNDAPEGRYDIVLAAVPHEAYRTLTADEVRAWVAPGGLVADLKGIWRGTPLADDDGYWTL